MKVFLAGRIAVEAEGVVIDERHFPGRQGRLLFAYLVAEHGRAVPRDELADVLWGDTPPATWEKALSVLASKLRGVLSASGLDGRTSLTAAFGCYRLDLPDETWVDVLAAESASRQAERFLAAGELERATAAATLAESLARGLFLPGDDGPWVEVKRRELAEVRARAFTILAETSLGTGDVVEAVRWADLAIESEPFRESGYRLLMKAHVAGGNRAEALQVYERCRLLLAEELGAYPSPETESIYRDLLGRSSPQAVMESSDTTAPPDSPPSRAIRKRPAFVAAVIVTLVAVVAAGAAIAVVATRGDGPGTPSAAGTPRVALVVPFSAVGSDDPSAPYEAALEHARSAYGVRTHIFAIDLSKPGLPQRVRNQIGTFGLVLLGGQFVDARFVHVMSRHPHTRFVVLDPDPSNNTALNEAVGKDRNATDVFFVTGPGAYLAGYLSALMVERRNAGKGRATVSMIVSDPVLNENEVKGFSAGAADAGALVLEDSTHDSSDPSVCEAIANRQIDEGSKAVYADAGACSIGALSAAGEREVWGIGADRNMSYLGPQILVSAVKRLGQAADYAIRAYLDGTLPQGHTDIGIERNAVDIVGINRVVPASIRAKIARVRQDWMPTWKTWETPLKTGT